MFTISRNNYFFQLPKNVRIALIIFVLALLWLLSGFLTGGDESNGVNMSAVQRSDQAFVVRARHSRSAAVPEIVSLRGKTLANRDVSLRAELSGRVAETPVERGQSVKAGDVICKLNPEDRLLRLKEAEAALKQARLEYDGAKRLKRGGYQSDTAIASAEAKQERAQAELERRKLDVANLAIRAPFDGVVDELPAEVGDWLRSGDVCARLLELSPLLITAQASENQALKLMAGQSAKIQLSNGSENIGTVSFVGQGADPLTRTFTIEVTLENNQNWRSGLSAKLYVPVAEHPGHLISPALLALDDQGLLGIRTLGSDRRVQWQSINLLSDTGDGVWVTGLPNQIDLITVGQEYVAEGQQVDIIWEQLEQPVSEAVVTDVESLTVEQAAEGNALEKNIEKKIVEKKEASELVNDAPDMKAGESP